MMQPTALEGQPMIGLNRASVAWDGGRKGLLPTRENCVLEAKERYAAFEL